MKVAIVVARFNEHITGKLMEGAQKALADAKADVVDVFFVPGAYELPFAAKKLSPRYQAIVALGGPATKLVVGTDQGITRLRGTWQSWQPPAGSDCAPIPVMPTYHPSYVLRNYTPKVRGEVWSDLKRVLELLGRRPGGATASES